MSKITLDTTDTTAIGDAIRTKLAVETPYKPGEMPAAILSIPSGGITPTGTISIDSNGTYDVTQYASAAVNVTDSDIDLSYLPNSTAADVVVSQDASILDTTHGNDWGKCWMPMSDLSSTKPTVVDNAVRKPSNMYCQCDFGETNGAVTVYACLRLLNSSSSRPVVVGSFYANSNGNFPNFHQYYMDIWSSVYSSDTYVCSGADFVVLAYSLNQTTKTVTFYYNAQKHGTKPFSNSGRGVGVGASYIGATPINALDIKYLGVVASCESDETIIANMQAIMQKCGVSA